MSVTWVVFLGGTRALVKVPQSDREFSFGNRLSKMSTPRDFVEKNENHRALIWTQLTPPDILDEELGVQTLGSKLWVKVSVS